MGSDLTVFLKTLQEPVEGQIFLMLSQFLPSFLPPPPDNGSSLFLFSLYLHQCPFSWMTESYIIPPSCPILEPSSIFLKQVQTSLVAPLHVIPLQVYSLLSLSLSLLLAFLSPLQSSRRGSGPSSAPGYLSPVPIPFQVACLNVKQ